MGVRANVDPKPKVWESSYLCFGANPISNVDPKGDDWIGRKHKDGSTTTHWDKKYKKGSKLGEGEFYIGESAIITGTDNKLYELRSNGKAYEWKPPTVVKSTGESSTSSKGFSIAEGASYLPASFNFTKEEAKQYQEDRANFAKGDYSKLTPEKIAMYTRWAKAEKDYKTMSLAVVGIFAAPFVAMAAVESGATYYIYQGGSWVVRKYGMSFIQEVAKEGIANRGNLNKMDWSDILVSTALSRWKFVGANGVAEMINATSDLSVDGKGYQNSFLIGTKYEKSFRQSASDLLFGGLRTKFGGLNQQMAIDQMQYQFDLAFPNK